MFQACVVVNVKTSGMFLRVTQRMVSLSQRLSRSDALVRSCWTRTVVFLQSCDRSQCHDLMTSHAWLKSKSHPHCVGSIRRTFAKLGSGAEGSGFREPFDSLDRSCSLHSA